MTGEHVSRGRPQEQERAPRREQTALRRRPEAKPHGGGLHKSWVEATSPRGVAPIAGCCQRAAPQGVCQVPTGLADSWTRLTDGGLATAGSSEGLRGRLRPHHALQTLCGKEGRVLAGHFSCVP